MSRIISGQLYADVPPSMKEQARIDRQRVSAETVDREYARLVESIPRA